MSSDVALLARLNTLQDELKREKRKNATWNRAYETLKADFDHRLHETNRTDNAASAMVPPIAVADPVDSTMRLGDVPKQEAGAVKSEPEDGTSAHRKTWIDALKAKVIELERVETTSATMIECKNREIVRQRDKVSSLEQENRVLKETVHCMVGDHVKVKQLEEENEILKRELIRLGNTHGSDQPLIQDAAIADVLLDDATEENKKEQGKKVETGIIPKLLAEIKELKSRLDSGRKQSAKRKSTPWMENFEKLRRYHAFHGHCGVKKRDDPVLFHFVVNQKTLLREFSGNKRERIDLLNSINFPWGARHPMSRYLDKLKLKSAIQMEGKAAPPPKNIDEKLENAEAAPDLPLTKKAIAARARETPVLLHPQLNDDHAIRPDELSPSQGGDMISFSTWKEREQQAKCSLAGILKRAAEPGDEESEEPEEPHPEGAVEDPSEDLTQEDDDTSSCEQGEDKANSAYLDETSSNIQIQMEHTSMGEGSGVPLNDEGKRFLDSSEEVSNVAKKPKAM